MRNQGTQRSIIESGFTLIELMVVVAIIGILASVAIPSFMRYIKKSRTAEARSLVEKAYNGARVYYYEEHASGTLDGLNAPPKQFPDSNPDTPAVSCCSQTGSRCVPSAALWATPTWEALKFSVDDPHYYQYSFVSVGVGADAEFTAFARGDLDCDTQFSTFAMFGQIDQLGGDPVMSGGMQRIRELE